MIQSNEDGYILASALAALFAMSLVAATLVSLSGSALARVKRMETSTQDRYALEAAIRVAASQLAVDPRRRGLSFDDGSAAIQVGDRAIRVDATWETARMDVNRASPEDIDTALRATGLDDEARSHMLAEVRTAQSIGLPLQLLDELNLSPSLLSCANEELTTFGGRTEFVEAQNIRAITGRPAAGARVRLDARPANGGLGRTAVLLMTGDGRDPYRVLDWRELRGDPLEACHSK